MFLIRSGEILITYCVRHTFLRLNTNLDQIFKCSFHFWLEAQTFAGSRYIRAVQWKTKFVYRTAIQKAPFLNISFGQTILLSLFSLYPLDKSEYGLLFCLPQINYSRIQFSVAT